MKTDMKAIAKILLIALLPLSCVENVIDSQADMPLQMDVDAFESYTVQAIAAQPILFNISSNTPWKIESDQQWCVPSPAMSSASSLVAEVAVAVSDNEGRERRTATLTLTAEGIDKPRVITVEQDVVGRLNVRPAVDLIPVSGGSSQFAITSNKPWTVISDAMWLNIDKTSGEGSLDEIIITASAEKNTVEYRKAKVTVEAEGQAPVSFMINQDGVMFEVSAAELRAKFNEEAVSVIVDVNSGWEAVKDDVSAEWYSFEKSDFNGGKSTLRILLDEFSDSQATVARSSSFTVKVKDNPNIRKQILIRQGYNPTTTYQFVLGDNDKDWYDDAATWSRRYADGEGHANNKVDMITEDGKSVLKCTWRAQLQKKLPASGTYTFNVKACSDRGCPGLVGNINEPPNYANQEIDYYLNVTNKNATYVYKTGDWNAAKIGVNEKKTVGIDMGPCKYSMQFTEATGGYAKITWLFNGEEIYSFVADGTVGGTAPLMYGEKIMVYMGNFGDPNTWYGWTKFDSWSYTIPDSELNWGD